MLIDTMMVQENDLKPEFKLKVAEWEVRKALAGHSNKVIIIMIGMIVIMLLLIKMFGNMDEEDLHSQMKTSIVTSCAKSVQICQTTEEMKRFMMLLVIMMLIENCQTTKRSQI